MIVNEGKIQLLNAQRVFLGTLDWGLFTNNVVILSTTVFADLVLAGWGGYSSVGAGAWGTPNIIANKAVSVDTVVPVFGNTSGAPQTFYGWLLYDPVAAKIVAAVNIGATVIPDGGSYPLSATISDDQA
jgi:hypothetical protein